MNELDNQKIRENQIRVMVKLFYQRFPRMREKPLDEIIEESLRNYLNSDLSIDEINDLLAKKYYKHDENKESGTFLDEMLSPVVEKERKKEKLFVKKKTLPNTNEEGYINNMIITTLSLMTFSLSCIGLIVLYLLKS